MDPLFPPIAPASSRPSGRVRRRGSPVLGALLLAAACATPLPSGSGGDDADGPDGGSPSADTDREEGVDTEPAVVDTGDGSGATTAPEGFEVVVIDLPAYAPEGDATAVVGGTVSHDTVEPTALVATVTSDVDGPQAPPEVQPDGTWTWSTGGLSAGEHVLTFTFTDPDGAVASTPLSLGVCRWPALESFDAGLPASDWTVYGDAGWDPGGWIEVTGNAQDRQGAVYKTSRKVDPGDVRLEFDIATGDGQHGGADGFAVSVIDAADPTALGDIVAAAASGGCLAYGVSGGCGSLAVDGFHIEFDTFHNQANPISDPTTADHVAITLDGDPGTHHLWTAVGVLEDLTWRHVVVQITGTRITVSMDGVGLLDGDIPGFAFDGGYLGVSGSTGYATNLHRLDNVQVYDRCEVPSAP